MTQPVTINVLEQTCESSPSQWEGRTSDGRFVYVRYRWGRLRIGFGRTMDAAVEEAMAERGISATLGDRFDGYLEYGQLIAVTSEQVAWPGAN